MTEIPDDLREALRTINRLNNLDDAVYDVRESIDWDDPISEGVDCSWDHPDVKEYSEAVELVKRYIK